MFDAAGRITKRAVGTFCSIPDAGVGTVRPMLRMSSSRANLLVAALGVARRIVTVTLMLVAPSFGRRLPFMG